MIWGTSQLKQRQSDEAEVPAPLTTSQLSKLAELLCSSTGSLKQEKSRLDFSPFWPHFYWRYLTLHRQRTLPSSVPPRSRCARWGALPGCFCWGRSGRQSRSRITATHNKNTSFSVSNQHPPIHQLPVRRGLRATPGDKQTNKMQKVNWGAESTHNQDKRAQEFRQEFLDYSVFECAVVPHAAASGAAGRCLKLLTSGSRVMLPKFSALAPHLHLGGPTRSHSAHIIDLIAQRPQFPLSSAPKPERAEDQQHRICTFIHFVFIYK